MSLHDAVLRAKEAAAHAKPFMKLIDALSMLDGELRAAGKLETDADAAAKRKADLEASMPALESQAKALQNTVNSLKAELTSRRSQFDKELEDIGRKAEKALEERHAKMGAELQAKANALKAEISTLGGTVSMLQAQKTEIEAQIGALRKSIEGARAAFHV